MTKRYQHVTAVDSLSFGVADGELFALLGTNGAGKTSTISCMTTLLGFDGGEVTIDGRVIGRDDHRIRVRVGVVFQPSLLDPMFTVQRTYDCATDCTELLTRALTSLPNWSISLGSATAATACFQVVRKNASTSPAC